MAVFVASVVWVSGARGTQLSDWLMRCAQKAEVTRLTKEQQAVEDAQVSSCWHERWQISTRISTHIQLANKAPPNVRTIRSTW